MVGCFWPIFFFADYKLCEVICSSSRMAPRFLSVCCKRMRTVTWCFFLRGWHFPIRRACRVFAELTTQIYTELSVGPDAVQQAAIKAKQFDRAIGLLEEAVVGGRNTVRQNLVKILTPHFATPNATATHEALLTLSRNRDRRIRLVTTNFDRFVREKSSPTRGLISCVTRATAAPRSEEPMGQPRLSAWSSSGRARSRFRKNLDDLVVSSGDFGRAYLTEGWGRAVRRRAVSATTRSASSATVSTTQCCAT